MFELNITKSKNVGEGFAFLFKMEDIVEEDNLEEDDDFDMDYNVSKILEKFSEFPCKEYDCVFKIVDKDTYKCVVCNYCNDYYAAKGRYKCLS
jgi:hypothetical protein